MDLLPPAMLRRVRAVRAAMAAAHYRRTPIPWTIGYNVAKHEFIARALADESSLSPFRADAPLPSGYGRGLDERCVEYPWVMTRLAEGVGLVLDAGSALNFGHLLRHPVLRSKTLHILTLAPEPDCFWQLGVSYVFGDLRAAPMRDGLYDAVISISTLEHVGCDNSIYTGVAEHAPYDADAMAAAMAEMWRMLKPGGTLFVTVPFGAGRNYRSFQEFTPALLDLAIAACERASVLERTFFRYSPSGWQRATEGACADCEFVEWVARTSAERGPFVPESDGAAAARAVACLALRKA